MKMYSKEKLILGIQTIVLIVSVSLAIIFLRFFVIFQAKNFSEDFSRQSFVELSRADTFLLARKLASLAKGEHVSCVLAKRAETVFFQEEKGNCGVGLFRQVSKIEDTNQRIVISITTQLSKELFYGFPFFLFAQLILALSFFFSQSSLLGLRYEYDLNLATISKQISHDIKSPMAALQILVNSPKQEVDLRVIKKVLSRLQQIMNHLYVGSTPNISSSFETMGVLLADLVQEKNTEYSKDKEVQFLLKMNSLENEYFLGDSFIWRRVLSNLVNNAIEATETKIVNIEISATKSGRNLNLTIKDFGKGINPEFLEHVGEKGRSFQKTGGMGLGVYSAKSFIETLGGKLQIESNLGMGTSVIINFPSMIGKEHILIEDDLALAKLWIKSAEKRGLILIHLSSPEEFQRMKSEFSNDALVFLDHDFPNSKVNIMKFGRELRDAGHLIFLSTGHALSDLNGIDWALEIRGKEPPWI